MISITKIGATTIAAVIVVGFGALGYSQYTTNQNLKKLTPSVITVTKTVVVTPTVEPTATPSAVRIYTPANAYNKTVNTGAVK